MTLARDLRNTRQLLGLTQREFAPLVGATQSDISRWQNGGNVPHPEMLRLAPRWLEMFCEKPIDK